MGTEGGDDGWGERGSSVLGAGSDLLQRVVVVSAVVEGSWVPCSNHFVAGNKTQRIS